MISSPLISGKWMTKNKKLKRVLVKVSGEALQGQASSGYDPTALEYISKEIALLKKAGVQVCLVVGGGNILRGKQLAGSKLIKRATADYMAMLATVMNALALQDALISLGLKAQIFSATTMHTMCEPYSRRAAIESLENGKIVLFAGGIGNPFVTTDTVSVIRSIEMDCDMLIKGTQVDGVYSADPKKDKAAKLYKKISHAEVISKGLGIMDLSAIHIAQQHHLPIVIFNLHKKGNLLKIITNGITKIENFSLIS
jgi:uridylate kinase